MSKSCSALSHLPAFCENWNDGWKALYGHLINIFQTYQDDKLLCIFAQRFYDLVNSGLNDVDAYYIFQDLWQDVVKLQKLMVERQAAALAARSKGNPPAALPRQNVPNQNMAAANRKKVFTTADFRNNTNGKSDIQILEYIVHILGVELDIQGWKEINKDNIKDISEHILPFFDSYTQFSEFVFTHNAKDEIIRFLKQCSSEYTSHAMQCRKCNRFIFS